MEQKCLEQGWGMLDLAIQPEPIHLFVRMFPSNSAAEVVKECKGITSFHLGKKHPRVFRLRRLAYWIYNLFR